MRTVTCRVSAAALSTVLLTLLLLLPFSTQAAEPLLEKIDLFEPGMNGIAHYRIPGIVVPNEAPFKNSSESILVQLADGRVMMLTRSVSEASRKLISTSPDGATDWTTPKFHPELWEPICMARVVAYPKEPGTLIFSNHHSLQRDATGREVPGGRGRRENLSIKLSRDSGNTWTVNKTLEAGPSADSDLAVLPDGIVICFFERDTRLSIARFNLGWRTDGESSTHGVNLPPRVDAKAPIQQNGVPAEKPLRDRPNVLFIGVDDLRTMVRSTAVARTDGSDDRRAYARDYKGFPATSPDEAQKEKR